MNRSPVKVGLILGGAKTVWSDLERAREVIGDTPYVIVATNCAGWQYPGLVDVWATLHAERFAGWRTQRQAAGLNADYRAYTDQDGHDAIVVAPTGRGSSGLYAAQVALDNEGCDLAILCGIPMDDTGGHIHWNRPWGDSHHYRPAFEAAKADGLNIRSMSGWTAELFGTPHDLFGAPVLEVEDMAWVIFNADFDYHPTVTTTIAYKANPTPCQVREECAAKAVSLGRAQRVRAPSRSAKVADV